MVQGLCVFGLRAGFLCFKCEYDQYFSGLLISTIFGC